MGNGYNSLYKHARADVIAEEQEAEAMARNMEDMQPIFDQTYAYQLACAVDAALMVDNTARLAASEAPTQATDPRTPEQIALDNWQDETMATRASDTPR